MLGVGKTTLFLRINIDVFQKCCERHSRSSEGPKSSFNISAFSKTFYFVLFCYFLAHTGLLFFLVFKHNLCSLRGTFSLNKNIRDFSLNSGGFQKPLFDRFVACNLSVYLLSLTLANPCSVLRQRQINSSLRSNLT